MIAETTPELMLEKIRHEQFVFPEAEWASVSEPAKDLIRKLLVKSPSARLSVRHLSDMSGSTYSLNTGSRGFGAPLDPEFAQHRLAAAVSKHPAVVTRFGRSS